MSELHAGRIVEFWITRSKIRSCWKPDATTLLGQHCSMLSTILFSIVTPDCGLLQAQQYCSILLTTRNNVAPTTLLPPVFNNPLELIIFRRIIRTGRWSCGWPVGEFPLRVTCLPGCHCIFHCMHDQPQFSDHDGVRRRCVKKQRVHVERAN